MITKSRPNFSLISSRHFVVRPAGATINTFRAVPEQQIQGDKPRFYSLAEPDIVGEQQIDPRRQEGAGQRFELIVLDESTSPEGRLQVIDVSRGRARPVGGVEEGRDGGGWIEVHRLREGTGIDHLGVDLDIPDDVEGLAVAPVFDAAQLDQRLGSGLDVSDDPALTAYPDQRPRNGGCLPARGHRHPRSRCHWASPRIKL